LDAGLFWNFQRGQRGERGSDQVLFSKGVAPLEWCYVDEFLERPTLQEAVGILEFGFAVLCPRLSHHAVSDCLIPAVDEENVLEMMSLAKWHCLERLENKCTEVIGCCLKSLGHMAEFLHLLRKELVDTIQGGDVHVAADVPIAADIQRAIRQSQEAEREEKIQLLQQAIKSSLQL
jgi:hypothetical protein